MPKRTNGRSVLGPGSERHARPGPGAQRVHLVIPTHTTRHLETCLAGIACQTTAPDSVVVTCDVDDEGIERVVRDVWPRVAEKLAGSRDGGGSGGLDPTLRLVMRSHAGEPRLNQVRNNGVRALLESGAPERDLVVVIDGDMVLATDAIARHRRLAAEGADVVVPFRINLSEERTRGVGADALLRGPDAWPQSLVLTPEDERTLANRDRRYRRQLFTRRIAPFLTKPHKPKLLGGHHAVRLGALIAVNGYDERFVGYGYDDDDLARRLHGIGGLRWRVAVAEIPAFHLWHPTRAPARPTDAPGYARFAGVAAPVRCERGLVSHLEQATPVARVVEG